MLRAIRQPTSSPASEVLDKLEAQGVHSGFVEVNGLPTHYLAAGLDRPATPILLVHGMMASCEYWVNNIAALAEHHPVYALSFWGHGWSAGQFDHKHTLANFVTYLRRFMQEVGLQKVNLVGHSMGGHIAARFAIEHPLRVNRLLLVSAAGLKRNVPTDWANLRESFNPALFSVTYRMMMLRLNMQAMAAQTQGHTLRMIFRDTLDEELGQIVAPTLLIWGRYDSLVPLGYSERWLRGIQDARLAVVDSGHTLQYHAPDEFNELVLDFCKEYPRPRSLAQLMNTA